MTRHDLSTAARLAVEVAIVMLIALGVGTLLAYAISRL